MHLIQLMSKYQNIQIAFLNINNFGSDYRDANYVAGRNITLPTHQFVSKKDQDVMIGIITK